ncbi:MAG: M2 family metallopeptidase [Planctomycetes bacterium]|nr:M2 family metallopeptidase [Planctomycetota bacterium]
MSSKSTIFVASVALAFFAACQSSPVADPALRTEVQAYLDAYNVRYRELATASAEAQWLAQTHIVTGDDSNDKRVQAADEALAAFTGSATNIETARRYLAHEQALTDLQARQLHAVLFKAGGNPQTVADVVKQRIAAETAQTKALYDFKFALDGEEITPNVIDDGLREETDLAKRRKLWEASKEVGKGLRPGLIELQRLRNACVRPLGYHDFFSYMASEYGMTTDELARTIDAINRDLRPLFRELHTWTRYELAKRYGQPVPDLIPAHWLPNRWGQQWDALVQVPGFDLDAPLKTRGKEWCIEQAERFYVSLGFPSLPKTFWERSSLYPVATDAGFKKNTHASAWHIDLAEDVRSLMSVEPNTEWYETTHHELGHIYYYISYSRPEVPPLLREGANRAYHEAVGSLMGLAAQQPRFVEAVGLEMSGPKPDKMQLLLKEALNYVVFIPWSTGTMFYFEKELYHDELPASKWNERWWELAAKYQGIAPPSVRGEEYCDAATKTHINDDPAGYYDYALSFVLLFQLHDHIAREILHEDPRDTNYYGRKEVGAFLKSILAPGASVDWKQLLKDKTGSELTAQPMLRYFEPLMGWLKEQNAGRKATLADI